jgi:predicted nucleic acid-binding protein
MKDPVKIFVDTDVFVALAREDDANHEKALSLLHYVLKQPVCFITSNYVFSECITVISMRQSHKAAVRFIEAMRTPESQYVLKRADDAVEEKAIHIFTKQTSKNTSFVDCTNMAFLQTLSLDAIFSFDSVYRKQGFTLVEDFVAKLKKAA